MAGSELDVDETVHSGAGKVRIVGEAALSSCSVIMNGSLSAGALRKDKGGRLDASAHGVERSAA